MPRLARVTIGGTPKVIDLYKAMGAVVTAPTYPAPTGVTATVVNGNTSRVTITAMNVPVEVWEQATVANPVGEIAAGSTSRTSGVLANGSYRYRVRARYGTGVYSGWVYANEITIGSTTSTPTPGASTPPTGGYPTADTTGVTDWSLLPATATAGDISTTSAGQVISNRHITGNILVHHPNVVIRNCRIKGGSAYSGVINTMNTSASGTLVEDCELGPDLGSATIAADGFNGKNFNYTMRRTDIHNVTDGVKFGAGTFEDNYIHDIPLRTGAHHDGVQIMSNGGGTSIVRHNTIIIGVGQGGNSTTNYNATVFAKADTGPIGTVICEYNYVDGCGYAMKWTTGPYGDPGSVIMRNNRFGHNSPYGQLQTWITSPVLQMSDNAFLDGVGSLVIRYE